MISPITDPAILEGYLVDASNRHGSAELLFRPRTREEVAEVMRWCQARGMPVTVTARRTSTTGAPVPDGGALLSTELLATIHAVDDADGGVLLGEYQAFTESRGLLFPPDPTSREECSLGGAIACNASGARSFAFGPTRPWVRAVELVTPTGEILEVTRDTPSPWPVPLWTEPAVKTAAGYFPAQNLLDLVIGSEGTLGVVTRARLQLMPRPPYILALFAWFPTRASMLGFLDVARGAGPRCIEYFDRRSLRLVRDRMPDVPEADSALFLEIAHDDPEPPLEQWFDLLSEHGALVDHTLVTSQDSDRARLHAVRHALPAAVNEIIARNGVRKVGTDFAVPASALPTMLDAYESVPMDAVCFGHIGDSHLHLNLLPKNPAELEQARAIYLDLARLAVSLGGTVSAEHGIGRLKKAHLALMVPPPVIAAWRTLKTAADPAWILGRGVLFDR